MLLYDGSTGFPLCIMDGSMITGYRTGAAGAVSAKLLARKDSKTIAVIGTGEQARMQVRVLNTVLPFKESKSGQGQGINWQHTAMKWKRN